MNLKNAFFCLCALSLFTACPTEPGEEDNGDRFSFPGEEVKCEANDFVSENEAILKGGKNNPTGRGEQSAVLDPCNNRIILFGGNDFQPEQCADFGPKAFQGDTWVYVPEFENWYEIQADTAPPARGRQVMAYDLSRKKIFMFGGRYRAPEASGLDPYQLFNDLWAFDANTDTWEELFPTGQIPGARTNSAMVYDDVNDQLVLFGGSSNPSGTAFSPLNDTYVLDLKNLEWKEVAAGGNAPPARLFHNMVMDGNNNQVLIYGGGDEQAFTGPFLDDVWALNLDDFTWSRLWQGSGFSPEAPYRRINAALVEDRKRSRIVMFGGHDDTNVGNRNDVWSFDPQNGAWNPLRPGDDGAGANCGSFCACDPDFVEVDMNSPERRQYHTFVALPDEDRVVLFGGKSDCGYLDDTWSLSLSDHGWTEVEPAQQGEACKRTGRENCEELCF
jgi:hypothetical protein